MAGRRSDRVALERRTKAELRADIRRLLETRARDRELQQAVHDLRVHEEEVRLQREQLLEARQELERSRDRYADLFENAPVGYITLDQAGVVEEINLTAAAVLGIPRAQILRMPFSHYVVPDDRPAMLEHMRRCRAGKAPVTSDLSLQRKAGEAVPVQLYSAAGTVTERSARVFRSAIIDLRERLQAEVERQHLLREEAAARAASEAKDRFLALLSHELRTPLAPVLLTVTDLERRKDVPVALRATLAMLRRNLELERRLIDDLLDVSRITRGMLELRPTLVDVHEALTDALEMCAPDLRGRTVTSTLNARTCHVMADPVRLRQAFSNLLRNAARATPAAGSVTVRTENPLPRRLQIAIIDTGIGIDPVDLERIFMPFAQGNSASQAPGLGLGLAICKAVVEGSGGRIRATSAGRGAGACFEVDLPAEDAPAEVPDEGPSEPAWTADGVTILLVEDHEDTRDALTMALDLEGFHVKVAASVAAAIEEARGGCDVVVSDLSLPDGSGFQLIQALNATHRVPSIALSGFGRDEDVRRSRAAGFDAHLTKPIAVEQLMTTIRSLCQRRGANGPDGRR
jgi:PAS domain S-box-containing protein